MQQLQIDMAAAYYSRLREVTPEVVDFACNFAAGQTELSGHKIMGKDNKKIGYDEYTKVVGGTTLGKWTTCAESVGAEIRRPPATDKSQLQNIITKYQNLVAGDYTNAFTTFDDKVQTSMVQEMTERGWPGMGVFYHRIGEMNSAVFQARRPSSIITVGSIEDMEAEEKGWLSRLNPFGGTDDADWIPQSQGTLRDFQNWWTSVSDGEVVTSDKPKGPDSNAASVGDMRRDPANALIGNLGFESQGIVGILADNDIAKSPLAVIASVGNYLFWVPFSLVIAATGVQIAVAFAGGYVTGGGIMQGIGYLADLFLGLMMLPMIGGFMLKFYLPLIPFIRVLFAVLTWIISVFEAVMMVPIAALAHLSSQSEGLAQGQAEAAWKLWLNILLRPVLTVIGFVGAMLVFNAFTSYVNGVFADMYRNQESTGLDVLVRWVVYSVLYCFIMYSIANTVFKMLDLIPDALGRWFGVPKDQSFDSFNEAAFLASNMMGRVGAPKMGNMIKSKDDPSNTKTKTKAGFSENHKGNDKKDV